MKKVIQFVNFEGERPLFNVKNVQVTDCTFKNGESPLKECQNLQLQNLSFYWKYPLWYGKNISITDSYFHSDARAGVWYSKNLNFSNMTIESPKTFRHVNKLKIENVTLINGNETLWYCKDVHISNMTAKGDYFGLNCKNLYVENFELCGNYCFDSVKNLEIHHAKLICKDAFWNSENVTVYDSLIEGEYIGWNAKNITFINCTIKSLQGLCYIKNLKIINCDLTDTNLAFEYSSIDAELKGGIQSVINPKSGRLVCDYIGELILQDDKVDTHKTTIILRQRGENDHV